MSIISGSVSFTTPRPFESKSATVTLAFTPPENVDPEVYTATVGQMARRRAEAMISDTRYDAEMANKPAGEVLPPTSAATSRTRTRAAAAPPPAPATVASVASAGGDLVPGEVIPPTSQAAPLPPSALPGSTTTDTDPLAAPAAQTSAAGLPVNLSDAALNNAITAKLSSFEAGTPERQALTVAIKNLRAEYTGGLETPWALVQDADKRTMFLGRLGLL